MPLSSNISTSTTPQCSNDITNLHNSIWYFATTILLFCFNYFLYTQAYKKSSQHVVIVVPPSTSFPQQTSLRAADLSAVKTLTTNTKPAGQQLTSPVAGLAVRTHAAAVTEPASQQVSSSKASLSAVKTLTTVTKPSASQLTMSIASFPKIDTLSATEVFIDPTQQKVK